MFARLSPDRATMTGARITMPDTDPPVGSPADVDAELRVTRTRLIELVAKHLPAVKALLADNIFSIDIFMIGVANRSFYLATGFLDALDEWNIFAAAPLVRLQLDSLIRVSYMMGAPRSDDVADHVLKGTPFNRLKDQQGRRLTDHHLIALAAADHPWIESVYSDSNEWIHLSRIQVLSSWEISAETNSPTLSGQFPMGRASIPPGFLRGMVDAMAEATDDLLVYMDIWRRRKGLPVGEARP